MSKYTTEVRFICETESGLTESVGYNDIDTVLDNSVNKIFDFDFPIFDENYRGVLERKILLHFYTREIGFETVGLWKLKLKTKLNEIMPYYNKLYNSELIDFNPLYTVDKTIHRGGDGTQENRGKDTDTSDGWTHNNTLDKYSDTPQGAIDNLVEGKYLTNARDTTNKSSYHNTVEMQKGTTIKTINDYTDHITGYESRDASDLILKFRKAVLNIDMMIIGDLDELFMQLWQERRF